MQLTRRLESAFRYVGLSVVYAIASGVVLEIFLRRWGAELGAGYSAVLDFRVARPYVYRVLSPAIVDAVTTLIPARFGTLLVSARLPRSRAGANALSFALAQLHWPGEPSVPVLVGILLMLGALWGTLWTWRALAAWALPGRPLLASTAPAIGILGLPATFVGAGFLYDFSDLFLLSLTMWAFVREKWILFYALLPLAVLNKEASVLVVAWWLAASATMSRRRLVIDAIATTTVGAGVLGGLWWTFRSAPGAVAQLNLRQNLAYLSSLRWATASDDLLGLGIETPVAMHVVNVVLVIGVWLSGRRAVPPIVERMFLVSVLAVAPLFLLFGFENEVRVFAIAFPSLFLLGVGAAASR